MLAKRIIPCLDIKDGQTVKGVNFVNIQSVGDPVELGALYAEQGADELVFLDITATHEGRKTFVELVKRIAREINIPFTVGGGISEIKDAEALLSAGADKVSINSSAVRNPQLINDLAKNFGTQFVVVAIDARRADGSWQVVTHGGTPHPTNTRRAALEIEDRTKANLDCWYGMEQEYTMMKDGYPLGFPEGGYPGPQGPYYCGVGAEYVFGREIVEEHMTACLKAGIKMSGINAEVMPGQWEFQVGPLGPLAVGDSDELVLLPHDELNRPQVKRVRVTNVDLEPGTLFLLAVHHLDLVEGHHHREGEDGGEAHHQVEPPAQEQRQESREQPREQPHAIGRGDDGWQQQRGREDRGQRSFHRVLLLGVGSAFSRSQRVMTKMAGVLVERERRTAVSVPASTPPEASTVISAPSAAAKPLMTSPTKSA